MNGMKKKAYFIIFAPVASAILLRLAFPKTAFYPFAFFALVPFIYLLFNLKNPKAGLLCGAIFGFTFHYANIFWLNTIAAYNPFAIIGIFLLGVYLGLYSAVFGWGSVLLIRRNPRFSFILLPCLWVVLEYIRNVGQLAFPWSYLAATQAGNPLFIQICDVTGVWGVSFLVALVNVVLGRFLHRLIHGKSLSHLAADVGLTLAILLLVIWYGAWRLKGEYKGNVPIQVSILQPNIPQKLKFASYAGTQEERKLLPAILESTNFEMLQQLEEGSSELVILPESAFTRPYFGLRKKLLDRLNKESVRLGAGILAGANREVFYNEDGELVQPGEDIKNVAAYNSAWYFQPVEHQERFKASDISKATIKKPMTYDKIHLVPFGEHLPYFDLIPGFQRIIVQTGSFLEGEKFTLFPLRLSDQDTTATTNREAESFFRFAVVICFESSFDWLLREFVRRDADFLVVITNDGWYEDSAGPFQHNDLSIFRAIETRRWIVRCSNRGISGIISPKGVMFEKSRLNQREIINGTIYPKKIHTIYERSGNLLVVFLLLPLLPGFGSGIKSAVSRWKEKKRKKSKQRK